MERLQVLPQWPGLVVQVGVNPQTVCFENDYDTLTTTPKKKDNKINLSVCETAYLPLPLANIVNVGFGEGQVGSFPETQINPDFASIKGS